MKLERREQFFDAVVRMQKALATRNADSLGALHEALVKEFGGEETEFDREACVARIEWWLLQNCSGYGPCRGCEQMVYWLETNRGKRAPYEAQGINHFASCPMSEEFRNRDRVTAGTG